MDLIKGNSSLNRTLILHRLNTLLPLFKLERLVHDSTDLDLARIEVVDGGGEFVGLGEGPEDCDFVADCIVRTFSSQPMLPKERKRMEYLRDGTYRS